jgi:hypothetical protein
VRLEECRDAARAERGMRLFVSHDPDLRGFPPAMPRIDIRRQRRSKAKCARQDEMIARDLGRAGNIA